MRVFDGKDINLMFFSTQHGLIITNLPVPR